MLCQAFLFFSFILTVEGLARNRSFVFFSPEDMSIVSSCEQKSSNGKVYRGQAI